MSSLRLLLRCTYSRPLLRESSRLYSAAQTASVAPLVETDACGIPVRPTWSVHELLSSHPQPAISPASLAHLHRLSALIPPEEGTPEHAQLTADMEDLIKLVEAVKLVDVTKIEDASPQNAGGGDASTIPDGRIWAEGTGIDLFEGEGEVQGRSVEGQSLLRHASRTEDGLYVVEAERTR